MGSNHFVIQRKVLISMLFLATTMLGYISYQQLDMEIIPNASLPMLYVQVNSRTDGTPEYMEQEAIIPVESAVAALENIERIESTAGRRRGAVVVYYEKRTDLKYAYLKLDERITALRGSLPDDFTLRVEKVDLETRSNILMTLQTLGDGGVNRVRNFTDQNIVPELLNIDGTATINVFGGRQKSVDIILNREMCDAYNISPSRVRNTLSRNMNQRQYGGLVKEEGMRYFVYLNAEYQDITQIEELVVGQGRNQVQLKDIAEVYYGEKEVESISRINGMDAVSMQVVHDAQANIIDLSHAVRKRIEQLNKKYREQGIEIIIQEDSAELMEKNIDQIINLALIGGLLAVFVLWVFLRNIRLVVVVALAIPVSVYTAFNFFFGAGITINSLTLMGIALAVGMLLDTSVVVLENIYRLRSAGAGAVESVVQGTREVWRAIVAATLTTVAVFMPFLFSNDYLIQLFGKHIGVSIISTLLVSLAVSLLLIPMVVHAIISRGKRKGREVYREVSLDNRAIRLYLSLLKTAIRNPGPVIIGAIVLFFATIVLSTSISVNKLSELETNQVNLYITMAGGTTLEKTDEVVARMEQVLMEVEEQKEVISNIQEEEAMITVLLKDDYRSIGKRSFAEIQADMLERLKDMPAADISTTAQTNTRSSRGGGGNSAGGAGDLQKLMGIGEDEEYLVLKGQDFELLVEVAEDVRTYLEELDNIRSVRLSVRENQPEVHLDLNSYLMSEFGVTRSQVGSEINAFQNEISSGVNFRQGSEEYEIMIKYDDYDEESGSEEKTIDELRALDVPDAEEENVYELQGISDIFFARGMREIARVNQEKQVELRYRYNSDVYDSNELLDYARSEIEEVIRSANIPAGVAVELVQEDSGLDEFRYLFIIALLLVYMILAAIFESFVTPFVLLLSIPFAAIGSFFLLTVTGNSLFNANTMMGFLILLGVVVNNAIILIDFMNILRKRGYRKNRAIMVGGMSRVRPILITTITTCVAMLPLAMGQSEYVKAIGPPFAITVIGGLSVSTLLTLVFVPMLYNALEQALLWLGGLRLVTRIILIALEVVLVVLLFYMIDQFMWQLAAIVLVIPGLPLSYWFITSSLRKAHEKIIPDGQSLYIRISNLVKIYGRDNRVSREFAADRRMARRAGETGAGKGPDFEALIWQLPLLLFLAWFTMFYLVSSFWQLVSSVLLYGYLLLIINRFAGHYGKRWLDLFSKVVLFGGPLFIMLLFMKKWDNLTLTLFAGGLWYFVLAVGQASSMLRRDDFKMDDTRKFFRWFVRLIALIPGIGHRREQFKALKGVSLEIGTGMFGLLGPNGAGKSTIIRIICGVLEQSYGKIWINGIDTQQKREELQGLIGYLPQEFGMYENMTAEAYLDYQAMLKGITDVAVRKGRIREVLESVHMWEHRRKQIGTYSGGMKQRIGIAQVLLHLPSILVVDEPTAGLDPRERIRFRNLLVELSRSRIVVFSTHIIEDISSSCTTMAVIGSGEVLFSGTPAEMTDVARGKVWRAHLEPERFEELTRDMLVIHHMRDGERIRVRCISGEKPFENAVEEHPLLEDAYLWLLRSGKNKN
jgi:multidrug efflux pump subunit AcrB/ABC-type multidrug transport system ATPase subunit